MMTATAANVIREDPGNTGEEYPSCVRISAATSPLAAAAHRMSANHSGRSRLMLRTPPGR